MTRESTPLSLSPRYALEEWQESAIASWNRSEHPERGPRHGIFDVFTGAGKTVVALGAMVEAARDVPDLRFAIVVPTAALMKQWADTIPEVLRGVEPGSVGRCGAGSEDSLATHRFVVYVLDSARKHLARQTRGRRVMLVVDECHRAASEKNQAIFEAETTFRLGLSATALRTDLLDENGAVLPIERQPHGRALGGVCHRLTFKDAIAEGLLPPYEIHHHAIALSEKENEHYEALTRDCSEAEREMERLGAPSARYMAYARNRVRGATGAQMKAAQELQNSYLRRKQWLYGVSERNRVARLVLADAARRAGDDGPPIRALLFNERVGDAKDDEEDSAEAATQVAGATALYRALAADVAAGLLRLPGHGPEAVALEHSKLRERERDEALNGFRDGSVRVLVSVKALGEGIDVPDADVGLSVASTASARQRIQTMGRLLRAPRDPLTGKRLSRAETARSRPKELHLLYVGGTADRNIYVGKDWADETGHAENRWWTWEFGAAVAVEDETPPKPPPTEEEAWDAMKGLPMPQPWAGVAVGARWTFRQDAIVRGREGPVARNGQEASRMLSAAGRRIRRDPRGVFHVTPRLGVVLKAGLHPDSGAFTTWACGRLTAPLLVDEPPDVAPAGDAATPLSPGDLRAGEEAAIVEELGELFGGKGAYFDVVKRGFLAAVDGDAATLRACRTLLQRQHAGRVQEIGWLMLLDAAQPVATPPGFEPRRGVALDILDAGVRAHLRKDTAMLRRCRDELARRAAEKATARLKSLAAALSILLGETRTIRRGGDEGL